MGGKSLFVAIPADDIEVIHWGMSLFKAMRSLLDNVVQALTSGQEATRRIFGLFTSRMLIGSQAAIS